MVWVGLELKILVLHPPRGWEDGITGTCHHTQLFGIFQQVSGVRKLQVLCVCCVFGIWWVTLAVLLDWANRIASVQTPRASCSSRVDAGTLGHDVRHSGEHS